MRAKFLLHVSAVILLGLGTVRLLRGGRILTSLHDEIPLSSTASKPDELSFDGSSQGRFSLRIYNVDDIAGPLSIMVREQRQRANSGNPFAPQLNTDEEWRLYATGLIAAELLSPGERARGSWAPSLPRDRVEPGWIAIWQSASAHRQTEGLLRVAREAGTMRWQARQAATDN